MPSFVFLGNSPWLDFVDTELNAAGEPLELLAGFEDLLRWGREAGLLDEVQSREIAAASGPAGREAVVREARELRSELREAATRLSKGKSLGTSLLERVNALLGEQPRVLSVRRAGKAWRMESQASALGPRTVLTLVAEDFARFLTTCDPKLLRRCANDECSVFFYDISKNHKRRWCSMDYCGNRAKAAGHRARQAG
jgi:predicted RNA-binding Zn ribbon-like protein